MIRARLTARAARDFSNAVEYYRDAGQSARFADAMERVFQQIRDFPESAQPTADRQVRRALLRGFPYAVFYRLTAQTINVIRIRHTSRTQWKGGR